MRTLFAVTLAMLLMLFPATATAMTPPLHLVYIPLLIAASLAPDTPICMLAACDVGPAE